MNVIYIPIADKQENIKVIFGSSSSIILFLNWPKRQHFVKSVFRDKQLLQPYLSKNVPVFLATCFLKLTSVIYFFLSAAITCPALNTPINGNAPACSLSAFGTSCTFSCQPGYALSDSTALVCGEGTGTVGEWSGTEPTCDGKYLMLKIVLYTQLRL